MPTPTPGAIAAQVVRLLREQTGIEAIGLEDDLAGKLGLDWLGRIDLIETLEGLYRITLGDDELAVACTPGQIADVVARALGLDPDYEGEI